MLTQRQPLIEKLAVSVSLVHLAGAITNRRANRVTQGLLEITGGRQSPLQQPVEKQLGPSACYPRIEKLFQDVTGLVQGCYLGRCDDNQLT